MNTPLTDKINTLRTRINSVTGGNDKNLYDAINTVCSGYDGVTPMVQSKIVEPLTTQQVITPDDGYNYLSNVIVRGYFNPFTKMTNFTNIFAGATLPETVVIDLEGAVVSSIYKTFNSVKGCKNIIIKNMRYPDGSGVSCQDAFRGSSFETIEFRNCVFMPANQQYPFYQCNMLQEIIGEIDMTYRTSGMLNDMQKLTEVRIVPSTIYSEFTIYNTKTLSNDSLISIANGFNSESTGTFDIRRSNTLSTLQNIFGNVVNDTFILDENGEMTLEQFINS